MSEEIETREIAEFIRLLQMSEPELQERLERIDKSTVITRALLDMEITI